MRKGVKRFVYLTAVIILLLVLALTGYFLVKNADWEDMQLSIDLDDLSNLPDIDISGSFDMSGELGGGLEDLTGIGGLGGGNLNMDSVVARVKSNASHLMYLQLYSQGDYNGSGFDNAPVYALGDEEMSPFYYMASAFEYSNYPELYQADIELVGETRKMLPYYTNVVHDNGDAVANARKYSAEYYVYDYISNGLSGIYQKPSVADKENDYRDFVYNSYLTINDSYREKLYKLGSENGIRDYSPTLIADIAAYVSQEATYNLNFKPYPEGEDMIMYFLTQAKEGICSHYAAAATMLYRAYGIPARYTVGYVCNTQANQTVEVLVRNAHAWTEVYIDDYGWVAVEVTSSSLEDELPPKEAAGPNTIVFEIKTDEDDYVYLKQQSYGAYTGSGFDAATAYEQGEINPQSLYAEALKYGGAYEENRAEINLFYDMGHLFPYYASTSYRDDVSIPTQNKTYRVDYVDYDYLTDGETGLAMNPDYAILEEDYSRFVKDQYLTIDESLKTELLAIADEYGISADSPTLIKDVAYYVSHAAYYNLGYPETPNGEDMVLYFLQQSKEGICVHYATAATMMYRALGIPARYTEGFAVKTFANMWTSVKNVGHAWTEVYIDGYGWVAVEVTGWEKAEATYSITVQTGSAKKIYDGKPLSADSFTITGMLPDDYEVVVRDYYSITNVGKIANKLQVCVLRNGMEVDNVEIHYEFGTLEITPRSLKIETGSKTEYDVETLTCDEWSSNGLAQGETLTLTVDGIQEEPGASENTVDLNSIVIKNASGEITTGNYAITYEYGWLTIIETQ